ncbi:hypothetical protein ALC62_02711 [Cyphomyrmex costatus]|uniref:Uncharacterized protein n=1 Tax=Cyphomyrmex costatus TaxID=456900 RepID=A0A195D1U5_9HYME|nr:hypothetical protein ALC62_02711 [Cyphomyrmex costatus]
MNNEYRFSNACSVPFPCGFTGRRDYQSRGRAHSFLNLRSTTFVLVPTAIQGICCARAAMRTKILSLRALASWTRSLVRFFFFLAAASSPTRGDHLGEPFVSAISRDDRTKTQKLIYEHFCSYAKVLSLDVLQCFASLLIHTWKGNSRDNGILYLYLISRESEHLPFFLPFLLTYARDFEPQCHVFRTKQLRKPRPCHLCHQAVIKQASCCRGESITSFPSGQ